MSPICYFCLLLFCSSILCKNQATDLYYQMKGYIKKDHPLDVSHYYKKINDEQQQSHVYFGKTIWEEVNDPKFRLNFLKLEKNAIEQCVPENYPDYFKFFSKALASLNSVNTTASTDSPCFTKTHFTYSKPDSKTVVLTIEAEDATDLLCTDNYLFATPDNYHFDIVEFKGKHEIHFKDLTAYQMMVMETYGLKIFRFCDSIANFIPDVIMTMYLFLGNPGGMLTKANVPPTKEQAKKNIEFIHQAAGFEFQTRNTTINVGKEISQSDIKSGDFVFIVRLDGLDPMEIWATGPGPGHSTIAVWGEDKILYIMESQDANYWPRVNIQKNDWNTWIQWAENAGYNVGVLPLRQDLYEKFNVTAVWEWFDTVEGHPYGFHNYFFSWFDTPDHSWPDLIDGAFFAEIWCMIEAIKPSTYNQMLGQALNKRLGTAGLNLSQVIEQTLKRNMTFSELMAIPENDTWIYNDGISLTCSCFVTAVYRAAGLFEGTEIFVTEFTPRDIVMLNFWDFNATARPKICQEADPDLPYCQLMGDVKMFFPDIMNTVDIYSHMNEKCDTIAPKYERIPANC